MDVISHYQKLNLHSIADFTIIVQILKMFPTFFIYSDQ